MMTVTPVNSYENTYLDNGTRESGAGWAMRKMIHVSRVVPITTIRFDVPFNERAALECRAANNDPRVPVIAQRITS
ncbi:MAG TPA: hypothetical protein VIJ86_07560 [Acidimicrobiales bacterium]